MAGAAAWWIVAGVAAWFALAALAWWIGGVRPRGDDFEASLALRLFQLYARLVHRLKVSGREHIPDRPAEFPAEGRPAAPLLIVANHTSGVDPVLIQAALPFEVRWIMAQDMRVAVLERFWSFARVIFVDRRTNEATRLREAVRWLKRGGAIGVFPEGNIERPAGAILPFREGVGMLAAASGAAVLLVVVEGTPQVDPAWRSLVRSSRASVRFLPVREYRGRKLGADQITADLRRAFLEATGWPANDMTPRFEQGEWWYVDPEGGRVRAAEMENRR